MLFYDDKLGFWNALEIFKISPRWEEERRGEKKWVQTVTFKNGDEIIASEHTMSDLLRVAISTFPAESGVRVITGRDDDNSLLIEPVLGWAVTVGMGVVPITVDGVNGGHNRSMPIILNSAQVQVSDGVIYANLDEYLADKARED